MDHILSYRINLTDGSFGRGMSNAQSQTQSLDNLVGKLATGLGAAFATDRLVSFGKEAVTTSAKMQGLDNAIKFASKSEAEGGKNLKYLDELTSKHGANLLAATQGYKTFLGSMQGVPYSMNQIRKMYEQVDVANRVMNLSAEDSQGVYLALGQIMSKGKVQAEELRGQIGERIPGAFAIAARAMGVTQSKLNKMMEDGDLMAVDFLPRFAAELEKTFGSGLEAATNSFQAQSNRRENAMLKEERSIGEKLQPAYLSLQDVQLGFLQAGNELIGFYQRNQKEINAVGIGLGTAVTLYSGYRLALTLTTAAQLALNAATAITPLGAIIGTVSILAGAYFMFSGKTKQLASEHSKLSDTIGKSRTEFLLQIETLKRGNFSAEERKTLIGEINTKYGEYLPNLLKEKETLEGIEKAAASANKAFEDKMLMAATQEQLEPLIKRLSELKKLEFDNKIGTTRAKAAADMLSNEIGNHVGSFYINEDNMISPAAIGEVKKLEQQISEIQKASGEVRKRLGLSSTGKTSFNASSSTDQSVSQNKSIRNVTVNIDSLVKKMDNFFQGTGDIKTTQNIRQEMAKLLISVVADSERALG